MKILFIGNSHTYMNDMPYLTAKMIESITGEKCDVTMLAYSGRTLKWHMSEEYFSVRFNLLYGNYDYCVIQEVAHPMTKKKDTFENAEKIISICKNAGTKPIVFETWAEKIYPEHQKTMNEVYREVSQKTGASLAIIGEVWERVKNNYPDIDLYYKDGQHASVYGDFLVAAVLAKVITGSVIPETYCTGMDFVQKNFIPSKEDKSQIPVALDREKVSKIVQEIDKIES